LILSSLPFPQSFPDKTRATATGVVLAGFGLSAFLFSTISHTFFPGNTGDFLVSQKPSLLFSVWVAIHFELILSRLFSSSWPSAASSPCSLESSLSSR